MTSETDQSQVIDPSTLETHSFEWGSIKWLVTPDRTRGATLTFGEVVLLPGKAHDRHNHPSAEEVLYFLSGNGSQMIDDQEPFEVSAGDTVHIPQGIYHGTENTGWQPLRFIAIYNPGGVEEKALEQLPDFQRVPAEVVATWERRT